MSRPIEATPVLRKKDAERFLADFNKVNELMKNPIYKKQVLAHLDNCQKLYEQFSRKGKQIGDCSGLENRQTRKGLGVRLPLLPPGQVV